MISKAHYNNTPRILLRSSLKVTLFSFIAACIAVDSVQDFGFEAPPDPPELTELKTEWTKKYPTRLRKRKDWFKDILKGFIGYKDEFLKPYKNLKNYDEKRKYVKQLLLSHFDGTYLSDNGTIRKHLKEYDSKGFKYFRETIVKEELTDYRHYLNEYDIIKYWNGITDEEEAKKEFALDTLSKLWKDQQEDEVIISKEELLQTKREGQRDGYIAGFAYEPSGELSPENLCRKKLYKRFEGVQNYLLGKVVSISPDNDKPLYQGLRVKLKHSKCEICNEPFKRRWFWQKRDCKMCGRLLCDKCCEPERLYWKNKTNNSLNTTGSRRTCKDGSGCMGKFRTPKPMDGFQFPDKVNAKSDVTPAGKKDYRLNLVYGKGYKQGYRFGGEKRIKERVDFHMKELLYKRFRDVVNSSYPQVTAGLQINLKLEYGRCEIEGCEDQQKDSRWYDVISNVVIGKRKNCKSCGRQLCKNCRAGDHCKDGVGCCSAKDKDTPLFRMPTDAEIFADIDAQLEKQDPVGSYVNGILSGNGATDPQWEDQDCHGPVPQDWESPEPVFQIWNGSDPDQHDPRRLGNMTLSDSFWQGFFTSMLMLLGTFVVYHLMLQKPAASRRKTYIQKKRSTFFKGRTSDIKSRHSVREVKGVFSQVIRRQLSKLDEN